jgi:hypothetical protein
MEFDSGYGAGAWIAMVHVLIHYSAYFGSSGRALLVTHIPLRLGYTWEPEINTPVTGALVFYPICASSLLCIQSEY